MRLLADYHTHTLYSHGKGKVEDNARVAQERGLKEVAITDHGPAHPLVGVRSLESLKKIKEDIVECRDKFPQLKILLGLEANVISTSGDLDISPSYIKDLDLLLVGLHTGIIPKNLSSAFNLVVKNWGAKINSYLYREARQVNTSSLVRAVYKHPVHTVVHPGLELNIDTRELARACAFRGTALEINCSHGEKTLQYLEAAAGTRVKFVINSDAHNPQEVGALEPGIKLALKLGIEEGRVLNSSFYMDKKDEHFR